MACALPPIRAPAPQSGSQRDEPRPGRLVELRLGIRLHGDSGARGQPVRRWRARCLRSAPRHLDLAGNEMSRAPVVWWSFASAFGFMVTLVLAANLFADGVRDAFDPRAGT